MVAISKSVNKFEFSRSGRCLCESCIHMYTYKLLEPLLPAALLLPMVTEECILTWYSTISTLCNIVQEV